jgi:2-dehydro-3-deoxyglucarate aldolase
MELARALKERLAGGGTVVGSWLSLGSASVAEIMALAGFEFLVVDLEHSPTSLETTAEIIRIVDLVGASPFVRVTSNDPNLIKRVLDAGAHGVIVPNITTADDARAAVRATRYPPLGNRGVGLHRAQGYGTKFGEYLSAAASGIAVVLQIESGAAVGNIRDILTVEGVDSVMIGPYDLSSDLGVPGDFESEAFLTAVGEVSAAAREAGVATGFHVVEPDRTLLERYSDEGYRFLVYSVDMRIIDAGARVGAKPLSGRT